MSVVGGNAGYAYMRTPEEQAELDRGLAKIESHFKENEEQFRQECTRRGEGVKKWGVQGI